MHIYINLLRKTVEIWVGKIISPKYKNIQSKDGKKTVPQSLESSTMPNRQHFSLFRITDNIPFSL